MVPDQTFSSLSRTDSLLYKLFSEPVDDPVVFYNRFHEFVESLSQDLKRRILLVVLSSNGDVILPVWGLSPEGDEGLAALSLTWKDLALAISTGGFDLGSDSSQDGQEKRDWLFDVIRTDPFLERGKVFTFERTRERGRPVTPRNRPPSFRYTFKYTDSSGSKECDCYVPRFDKAGEVLGSVDAFCATAIQFPSHQTEANVWLLIMTDGMPDERLKTLMATNLVAVGYRLVDELRSQVSSVNPSYISRYFQIEFGGRCVKHLAGLVAERGGVEFREAFFEFLFGRAIHGIAARHIIRQLSAEPSLKKITDEQASRRPGHALSAYLNDLATTRALDPWRKKQYASYRARSSQQSRLNRCRVIVSASTRGGVGKSTISYGIASLLAFMVGIKVCFVEMDISSPSVFFFNPEYRKFIELEGPKRQLEPDPITKLMKTHDGNTATFRDQLERCTYQPPKDVPQLHIIGASPNRLADAQYISQSHLTGGTKAFTQDLIAALAGDGFDWVVIDTGAGLRDFADAVSQEESVDLLLLFSRPTKSALLSACMSFSHGAKDVPRILVVNESRDIDRILFGGADQMQDFIEYWAGVKLTADGEGPPQDVSMGGRAVDGIVKDFRRSCYGVVNVPWHEKWSRLDEIATSRTIPGLNDLLEAVFDTAG